MANSRSPWFIAYGQNPGARVRLFCFHHAGGSASTFRTWPAHLARRIELLAVQLPGREGRSNEQFIEAIDDLAINVVDAMTPYLDRPYVVFGHSLGAIGGFEVIRELKRRGLEQPFLFVPAGRQAPHLENPKQPISSLPDEAFVEALVRDYANQLGPILRNSELRDAFIPQIRADFLLSEGYRYRGGPPPDCRIAAFAGMDEEDLGTDALNAWAKHTSRSFRTRRFPGDHFFVKESERLVIEAIGGEVDGFLA